MLAANIPITPDKRGHTRNGSLPTPDSKRQRRAPKPGPEYISLVSGDEEEYTSPTHRASLHNGSCWAYFPQDTAPSSSAADAADRVSDRVDRLMADYTRNIPRQLYGKKAKYYVVWKGHQCGIFLDWNTCQAQVTGFKGNKYQSTTTYEAAVAILRQGLSERLEQSHEALRNHLRNRVGVEMPYKPPNIPPYEPPKGPPQEPPREPPREPPEEMRNEPRNETRIEVLTPEPSRHTQYPSPPPPQLTPPATNAAGAAPPTPTTSPEAGKAELPPQEPVLCKEQQDALDLAVQGRNLFITGSGGCGKSVLIKAIHKRLLAMDKVVHILAPTGQAALNIGGRTIFSYAAWVPEYMRKSLNDFIKASRRKRTWKRLIKTQVLIIDEISMVENQVFERLSRIMAHIRCEANEGSSAPFGGVQIIVVGDFCQLPPVKPFRNCLTCGTPMVCTGTVLTGIRYTCPGDDAHGVFREEDKWAFKAPEWNKCNFIYVQLTKIHRQQDEEFVRILQKCRLGEDLEAADRRLLLQHPSEAENGTRLFCLRIDVEDHNEKEFAKLKGRVREYWALDQFRYRYRCGPNEQTPDRMLDVGNPSRDMVAEDEFEKHTIYKDPTGRAPASRKELKSLEDHRYHHCLALKLRMPVILLSNINLEAGLCNGSQGVICGFVPASGPKILTEPQKSDYRKDEGAYQAALEKYKRSLMAPRLDTFGEPQQKNYEGDEDGVQSAKQRYDQNRVYLRNNGGELLLPEVRFANGLRRVIGPDTTVNWVGTKSPYSFLSRTQIPLVPGWALTIHKSQSLSLDRVIVKLASAFEKGQAYVALSRARSLRGLRIDETSEAELVKGLQLDAEVRRFLQAFNDRIAWQDSVASTMSIVREPSPELSGPPELSGSPDLPGLPGSPETFGLIDG
ncbi:ATP-dependent DNA helicase pfh1 [Colletotrichum shisoi]|uniref:ATP-dependent DNA helicase n=1 Tax=Colletotrichum shisoi TaxID=2078593 RepID=A0A5Q4BLN2_9PEZI|nr:ATP-dependent DNA helicase pfh1 [Colletotrichum shisoi]